MPVGILTSLRAIFHSETVNKKDEKTLIILSSKPA
jgi:hypothetical protein